MDASITVPATSSISLGAQQNPPSHLVVLLHGVGADAASFEEVARALSESMPRAAFVVPDGLHPFDGGGTGRQWFSVRGVTPENRPERVRVAGGEVSKWIDGELARRGVGADRLVVGGFSQGAIVAAWLGVHRDPRPAAVLMLSGRVAEDQTPATGAGPRVFIGHGDRDPVMPVAEAAHAAHALEAWGASVTTHIYPGLGHQVDARELRDARDFLASLEPR